MLGFVAKRLLKSSSNVNNIDVLLHHQSSKSKAFLSSSAIKSSPSNSKGDALTVSYLVNSCGVAADTAKRISKYFNLKSPEKAARSLNFFRSRGFTDAQISSIVTRVPQVLNSIPDKALKPKFDFLASLGVSHDAALKIISSCPRILTTSVDNKIAPVLECLKNVAGSMEEVLILLTRFHRMLVLAPVNSLEHNIAALREVGMSSSQIWRFILTNGYCPSKPPDRFKVMVEKALAMGFDPRKHKFGDAVNSFMFLGEDTWEQKVNTFKKWGWSDIEFLMAFKKQPRIMVVSEKKIDRIMDYLVNTMGLEASVVAGCPYLLQFGLESRIIPRCSVVQFLISKGLIGKDGHSIASVLIPTEEDFILLFVKKHQEVQAELMDLYLRLKKKAIREPISIDKWHSGF